MSNLPATAATLTDADVKTLEQAGIIPAGTPKAQIAVFAKTCAERGLSAFNKEIYLVGYGGKYSVIVGINGFRKIAAETGQHAGTDDVVYDLQPDGAYKTAASLAGQMPKTATCTVYRMIGGTRCPYSATVVFKEFSTGKNKWAEMPFQMIAKVAEAFALRKGFSDRLTGLSIEEEGGAYEGATIQAAETTRPELAVDVQALADRIADCWTNEALMALYKENKAHEGFAPLFTERRQELETMRQNGQIQQ
ncbi:MAG: phage recombination protein Bet [Saprospiraceae bacterium]|nr:phage recombination protein Bet [Saprospiraceae bacterium]